MNEETMAKSGEQVRGRPMTVEEYLGHLAYVYAAAPEGSAEETVAKGLLEMASERLGVDPQEVVGMVLRNEPGGRVLLPWPTGTGVLELAASSG